MALGNQESLDHERMHDVVMLSRIADVGPSEHGTVSASDYRSLANHYLDLRERLEVQRSQPDDVSIVIKYAGNCHQPVLNSLGDAGYMLVAVVGANGETRELYRGSGFDDSEYDARTLER